MRLIPGFGFLAMAVFVSSMVASPPVVRADGAGCGSEASDESDVAAVRATAGQQCPCAGADNHGQYVSCVAGVASDAVANGNLREQCQGDVVRCAARSTCGREGFVACCRTTASGRTLCGTKRDASACRAPRGGDACVSNAASCCDACTAAAGCPDPPPCGHHPCSAQIDATCGSLSGHDRSVCAKGVIDACKSGQIVCTTTTTTSPSTTSTTAASTTSTTAASTTSTTAASTTS